MNTPLPESSQNSLEQRLESCLRPSVRELEPYDPAFSEVRINLSANENAFGIPNLMQAEFQTALCAADPSRYPRPLANELRQSIAKRHHLPEECVIVGNGGDELIFNILLAFGGKGHSVVCAPPDFSVYKLYAELLETKVISVNRDQESFKINRNALIEAASKAELVFLTSPNNPTGNLISTEDERAILEAAQGLVLIDEAYIEFSDQETTALDLLGEYPNLMVLRTFSKAYALAGARVGYLMADERIIRVLQAVRQPYSVNVLSQQAALVVLTDPKTRLLRLSVLELKREREKLYKSLSELPSVKVWKSDANFIFVRIPEAGDVYKRLRDEFSILVRDFSTAPLTYDCLRITVGTPEENAALIAALTTILKERTS